MLDLGGPSRLADVEAVLIAELARQLGMRIEPAQPSTFGAGDGIADSISLQAWGLPVDKTIPIALVGAAPGDERPDSGQQATRRGQDRAQPCQPWCRPRRTRTSAAQTEPGSACAFPPGNAVAKLKSKLRANRLVTVCEEASCPNIHECFGKGTATFMILGEVCTRRCSFCDVAHGRPKPPDADEPRHLAETIRDMGLRYVVITSVDRDDLRDGGASHFAECIREVRGGQPGHKARNPDF